jgi:hypothetical protein
MRSFNLAEAVHKIPSALEDMLVRGAYLEYSARALEQSRHEQEARVKTMQASQPPFLFLRPKETRAAFLTATRDSAEDLAVIDKALALNKQLSAHLRTCSEEMLEQWLRTHCEEYRMGMASASYAMEWEHALTRATQHAQKFLRILGTARNMAPAGYDSVREVFSPGTYEAINQAHDIALQLETEIAATNAIAQEHDKLLARTVFNDPMPRLEQEPYAAVVAQIASMPPLTAQAEFNRVIAAVEDLINREMVVLRNRMQDSGNQHAGRTAIYVRNAWNLLHNHAVEHSVEAEYVGAVVEQTERSYMAQSLMAS